MVLKRNLGKGAAGLDKLMGQRTGAGTPGREGHSAAQPQQLSLFPVPPMSSCFFSHGFLLLWFSSHPDAMIGPLELGWLRQLSVFSGVYPHQGQADLSCRYQKVLLGKVRNAAQATPLMAKNR